MPIAWASAANGGQKEFCRVIQMLLDWRTRNEDGQGLAEYALILALIAIVAIVALLFLGGQVSSTLSEVGESI